MHEAGADWPDEYPAANMTPREHDKDMTSCRGPTIRLDTRLIDRMSVICPEPKIGTSENLLDQFGADAVLQTFEAVAVVPVEAVNKVT